MLRALSRQLGAVILREAAAVRPAAVLFDQPRRGLAAPAKKAVRKAQHPQGGKGGKSGAVKKKKLLEEEPMSKAEAEYNEVLRIALHGDGKQQKPVRTEAELVEMKAHAKNYSREMMEEDRAHRKVLGELLRIKHASVLMLPPALIPEAATPFEQLEWCDQVFPYDARKPSETPPIEDFAAKVAAVEAEILKGLAAQQRLAEAELKRLARTERKTE
ncbi:hypothetical protein T492DRAFT_1075443 [Pavlovales sp. CCMP2436]|nr:hypothetical protein T492DRAFT_1075443 [Pavlovales sp. CCMP2436]